MFVLLNGRFISLYCSLVQEIASGNVSRALAEEFIMVPAEFCQIRRNLR